MLHEADKKLYQRLGIQEPEHIGHITEEDLAKKIKIEANHKWRQRGNKLICECELGNHVAFVPTSKILKGTDENGMPMLTEILT